MPSHPSRVIVISEHYAPSTGATAQLLDDLCTGLVERGIDITVITSTRPSEKESRHISPRVVRISPPTLARTNLLAKTLSGVYFSVASLVWLLLKAPQYSKVLIVSNPPFIAVNGLLLFLLRRISYFFLLQDLFPRSAELAGILPNGGPISAYWRNLIRLSCLCSSTVIVLSHSMRQRSMLEYKLPKSKFVVINNWAVEHANNISKRDNPIAKAWGLTEIFTVQYSGNFGRLHDIMTILEAARLLSSQPIQFLFVGGGQKYQQILDYKQHFSLENISLHPYQSRSMLPTSLGACDISAVGLVPGSEDTVAPSKFYGILASGKPVLLIGSAKSEIAFQIKSYNCGLVIEPGDSPALSIELTKLVKSPELLITMAHNALKLYKDNYGYSRSIDKYHSLLNN